MDIREEAPPGPALMERAESDRQETLPGFVRIGVRIMEWSGDYRREIPAGSAVREWSSDHRSERHLVASVFLACPVGMNPVIGALGCTSFFLTIMNRNDTNGTQQIHRSTSFEFTAIAWSVAADFPPVAIHATRSER